MISISDICEWTGGKVSDGTDKTLQFSSFSNDSRTLSPGALYVALKGENFDGHTFAKDAEAAGASACLVEKEDSAVTVAQIVVPNTLKALQDTAQNYRKTLDIPVIAITGSNGKTTTKNYIAAVLDKKYRVAYTKGNLNNHVGLPLSVLSIKPDDEIAVLEVGTNHPGEIKSLADICMPTAAVITNIGIAHIEYFGSKEAIAKEKGSLTEDLPTDGFFVLPADDEFTGLLSKMTSAKKILVSASDIAYKNIVESLGRAGITARHIVIDALLAAAVGKELGIAEADIIDALIHSKNEDGRFMLKKIGQYDVIDDSYNANPDSVCAAIDAMKQMYPDRRKIIALGKLAEQGDFLREGYERIVKTAQDAEVAEIIFVGIGHESTGIRHVKTQEECAQLIKNIHKEGDIVLLKGSKSAEMKKVLEYL